MIGGREEFGVGYSPATGNDLAWEQIPRHGTSPAPSPACPSGERGARKAFENWGEKGVWLGSVDTRHVFRQRVPR